jgi:hypothetical protein
MNEFRETSGEPGAPSRFMVLLMLENDRMAAFEGGETPAEALTRAQEATGLPVRVLGVAPVARTHEELQRMASAAELFWASPR